MNGGTKEQTNQCLSDGSIKMMDQRINSEGYVEVLSEPTKFQLSVCPS